MAMSDPFYSKEQADSLHQLRERAGGPTFDAAWTALIADIKKAMASGTAPSTPLARQLANRWKSLVTQFTGGDPEVERLLYGAAEKLRTTQRQGSGGVPDIIEYVRQAADRD